MNFNINIEPLHKWPEEGTESRRKSPFKASWSNTLELLSFELEKVSARNVNLKTMHSPEDFRLDGKLRSDTRAPEHPGVVLTFEKYEGWNEDRGQSEYSEMRFPCDTFTYWKDNVRAIALALNALRMVDRFGVRSGSQYAGFRALPPGDFEVTMTPELAADFIAKGANMGNVPGIAKSIIENPEFGAIVYKTATKTLHPDKGGDPEEFKKLEAAWRLVKDVQKQNESAKAATSET